MGDLEVNLRAGCAQTLVETAVIKGVPLNSILGGLELPANNLNRICNFEFRVDFSNFKFLLPRLRSQNFEQWEQKFEKPTRNSKFKKIQINYHMRSAVAVA